MSEYCYEEAVRDAKTTNQRIVNQYQEQPWQDQDSICRVKVLRTREESLAHYFPNSVSYDEPCSSLPGIGGAPTRVSNLPTDPTERKRYPVASGVLDYFPDALAEIANVSWSGNEQHNPGMPLHWDRSKSGDEADAMMRHFMARGTRDTDGKRHSAKAAWRSLALLQKEIEADREI